MSFREGAVRGLAALTRRIHPRGTFHLVRRLHTWERRPWFIEDIVPFEKNYRVWASTRSFVEWLVYFFGEYEPEVAALIRRSVRPGHAAIDVGANVGYLTLVMADAAKDGTVLACEPHPDIHKRMIRNLELNDIGNVRPRQVAVSDRPGVVTLFIPNPLTQSNLSTASLQKNEEFLNDAESVEVEAVTIDEIVAGEKIEGVDLLKIDVEGYEGPALEGASQVLERDRPSLIFEYRTRYWDQAGYDFEDVRSRLRGFGYEAFFNILPSGNVPIGSVVPDDMNVFVPGAGFA